MPDSRWLRQIFLRLRTIFHRDRVERELDEELQFHIEQRTAAEIAAGLSAADARRAALLALGGIEQRKEECRDTLGVRFIDDLARDLRCTWRSLRHAPGFSALLVLLMALGIGANTAVFDVVNAVLLRPLAYRDADRIVTLGSGDIALGRRDFQQVSIPNFQDWHDQSSSFEAMAYYRSREVPVMAGETAEYARATEVGAEYFRAFGVEPRLGRFFTAEEMKSAGAAIISYSLWQNHFAGDPDTVGRTIRVFGLTYPIAGVLPPGFGFPDSTDIWIPARVSADDMKFRVAQNWLAVGRLKSGVPLKQAQVEMGVIAARLAQRYPESNGNRTVAIVGIRDRMVGDVRLTLYLLLSAVAVVLLIACANTATLLLGRATTRMREIAVRAALGASRRRIIRQLLTESLLLALLAGTLGLLIAWGASKALVALAPADLRQLSQIRLDGRVLGFTIGLSVITTILFGLTPALCASRIDLQEVLKAAGNRSTGGRGVIRLRGVLVAGEIALSVVLLTGAGLLTRSLVALQNVPLGFRPEHVIVMRATVPASPQSPVPKAFFRDLLPKIAGLPGVLAAGATMVPPGRIESSGAYFVDRMPAQLDVRTAPRTVLSVVTPGTFAALGIPLKGGRDFADADTSDRPPVAIVNETLVRRAFGGHDPIGRSVVCTYDNFAPMRIVGVVGDVRQQGPGLDTQAECYMTYRQHSFNGNALSVVARTAGDPVALIQVLRRLTHETSPDVPVTFTTMEQVVSDGVATPRFRTVLSTLFAGLAVCLSMTGVYGAIAYAVNQRSNEIALRMALGANTPSVLRLVLGHGVILASLGIIVGLGASVAVTRLLTAMLFRVKPIDPLTFAAVAVALGAVTVAASYVPARRASRIDPMTALREE